MDAELWALAFTLLPWPERQKAELWACLQAGQEPELPAEWRRQLAGLARELPRHRDEAERRGARLALPGDPGVDPLLEPLPYPVALWVRGTLPPAAGPALAMVGSRDGARPALQRASDWARTLTAAGVAVLSGLARGVDGAAPRGAPGGCRHAIRHSGRRGGLDRRGGWRLHMQLHRGQQEGR